MQLYERFVAFWKTILTNLGTQGDNRMILTSTRCIIPYNFRNAEAQGSPSVCGVNAAFLAHLLPVYKLASNQSSVSTSLALNALSIQRVFSKKASSICCLLY